jgi:hypothetical protein
MANLDEAFTPFNFPSKGIYNDGRYCNTCHRYMDDIEKHGKIPRLICQYCGGKNIFFNKYGLIENELSDSCIYEYCMHCQSGYNLSPYFIIQLIKFCPRCKRRMNNSSITTNDGYHTQICTNCHLNIHFHDINIQFHHEQEIVYMKSK